MINGRNLAPLIPKELRKLCDAIDSIPHMQVVETCIAGTEPVRIYMDCDDIRYFAPIGDALDLHHGGLPFKCEIGSSDAGIHLYLYLPDRGLQSLVEVAVEKLTDHITGRMNDQDWLEKRGLVGKTDSESYVSNPTLLIIQALERARLTAANDRPVQVDDKTYYVNGTLERVLKALIHPVVQEPQ